MNGDLPQVFQQREVWQCVIAECVFHGGSLRVLRLHPIVLNSAPAAATAPVLDGKPRLASGSVAREILGRLQSLSNPYGTKIEIRGNNAEVRL